MLGAKSPHPLAGWMAPKTLLFCGETSLERAGFPISMAARTELCCVVPGSYRRSSDGARSMVGSAETRSCPAAMGWGCPQAPLTVQTLLAKTLQVERRRWWLHRSQSHHRENRFWIAQLNNKSFDSQGRELGHRKSPGKRWVFTTKFAAWSSEQFFSWKLKYFVQFQPKAFYISLRKTMYLWHGSLVMRRAV